MDEKNHVFYALTCIKDKHTSKCQTAFFTLMKNCSSCIKTSTRLSLFAVFLSHAHTYTQLVSDKHTSNNHFGKNHHQKIEKTVAKIENAQKWAKIKRKNLG